MRDAPAHQIAIKAPVAKANFAPICGLLISHFGASWRLHSRNVGVSYERRPQHGPEPAPNRTVSLPVC